MSNWPMLQYIYVVRWCAVWFSGTESHNPRMSYNKCGLMYFINCIQICGCWQRDISDTVRCAWQWWQQSVVQHQWGATGCLYCENMLWGCVSVSGSEITQHAVSDNNTTQHPSYINNNNLRFQTVASITAIICVTQSVCSVCAVSTDGTVETWALFYLTNIVCDFHPLIRRACGRSVQLATLVRST